MRSLSSFVFVPIRGVVVGVGAAVNGNGGCNGIVVLPRPRRLNSWRLRPQGVSDQSIDSS